MTTADEGHLENTVLISYDKLFVNNNGKLKVGRVASINDRKEGGGGGELVLASGETILYDALVLAPGSHWDGPLAFPDGKEETIAYINEWRRKFEAAQSIVLGGGGAVGIGECHTSSIVLLDLSHQHCVASLQSMLARSKTTGPRRRSPSCMLPANF